MYHQVFFSSFTIIGWSAACYHLLFSNVNMNNFSSGLRQKCYVPHFWHLRYFYFWGLCCTISHVSFGKLHYGSGILTRVAILQKDLTTLPVWKCR
jgi:hypothetical protein